MPFRLILAQTITTLLLTIPFAVAEDAGEEDTEALWEMRLAAFGRYGAAYPASEEYQVDIIPLPLPIYRGKFLRLGDDQENPIRGRLFRRERIKLDFAFDLNFPSDSDDIDARTGMPDLDLLLEVGPELELEFASPAPFDGRWFLGLQLRPAFSFDGLDPTYQGLVFSPELTYRKKLAGKLKNEIKIRLTPAFANSKYMDFFYSVDPAFATPERPAFNAKSGYLGTDFTVNLLRRLNDSFELLLGARVSSHQGAANEDSPLFTDDMTYSVYAAFTWKFWESERRAPQIDSLL
ncbi:MAG: MipA/OmpV family protein [Gammaproteobacteria bacterium]|nr:MipA/OmpV family protein [Gammaproteobacteria bacterium]